jgi:hypothetical protein
MFTPELRWLSQHRGRARPRVFNKQIEYSGAVIISLIAIWAIDIMSIKSKAQIRHFTVEKKQTGFN